MAFVARHRLAFQIQVTVVAVLLLFGLLVGLAWMAYPDPSPLRLADGIADLLTDVLPAPTAPRSELQPRLERLALRIPLDIAAFGSDGETACRNGPGPSGPEARSTPRATFSTPGSDLSRSPFVFVTAGGSWCATATPLLPTWPDFSWRWRSSSSRPPPLPIRSFDGSPDGSNA